MRLYYFNTDVMMQLLMLPIQVQWFNYIKTLTLLPQVAVMTS